MRGKFLLLALLVMVLALLALSGCLLGTNDTIRIKDEFDVQALDCFRNNAWSPQSQKDCLVDVGVKTMREGGDEERYRELCEDFAPLLITGGLKNAEMISRQAFRPVIAECEDLIEGEASKQGIANSFTLPLELYNGIKNCKTHRCTVEFILSNRLSAFACRYAGDDPDVCVGKVAMQRKDPSQCEIIRYEPFYEQLMKAVCYYNVAHDTGDQALCEKIKQLVIEEGLYNECVDQTWEEYKAGKTTSYVDESGQEAKP